MVSKTSNGVTPTENYLATLCQNTFLNFWSWPNPVKSDSNEMCDLLVVFESTAFIFFDRAASRFSDPEKDLYIQWKRWKKEAIDKQINTAYGAEKYLLRGGTIYADRDQKNPIPTPPDAKNLNIIKIVVANGASEAYKTYNNKHLSNGLEFTYSDVNHVTDKPFHVHLERNNPIHVLDADSLTILLSELDTVSDISAYFSAKEKAIKKYQSLNYGVESDLLATYLESFDDRKQCHSLTMKDSRSLKIHVGRWRIIQENGMLASKKAADKISYLWDDIIQQISKAMLRGEATGNFEFGGNGSVIHEMASEPRMFRRALSEGIYNAGKFFPDVPAEKSIRELKYFESSRQDIAYLFLQVQFPKSMTKERCQELRRYMLRIACGVAKNKNENLSKVAGIATYALRHNRINSWETCLLSCDEWTDENRRTYEQENVFDFFDDMNMSTTILKNYPD